MIPEKERQILLDIAAGLVIDVMPVLRMYKNIKLRGKARLAEIEHFRSIGIPLFENMPGVNLSKVSFEELKSEMERLTLPGGLFHNMQIIQMGRAITGIKGAIDSLPRKERTAICREIKKTFKGFETRNH